MVYLGTGGGGGGDFQRFGAKMLVVRIQGFGTALGCQRRIFDICVQCGTF